MRRPMTKRERAKLERQLAKARGDLANSDRWLGYPKDVYNPSEGELQLQHLVRDQHLATIAQLEAQLAAEAMAPCPDCDGSGARGDDSAGDCDTCGGTGGIPNTPE